MHGVYILLVLLLTEEKKIYCSVIRINYIALNNWRMRIT